MNQRIKLIRTLLILALVVSVGRLFTLKTGRDWLQTSRAAVFDETTVPSERTSARSPSVRPQDSMQNPLFESFTAGDDIAPVLQARTADEFGYELIGTLVTSTSLSRAIFRNTQSQETVICQRQDRLDSVTVAHIEKDRVVLQEPSGERFVLVQSDYQGSLITSLSPSNQREEIPARTYPGEQFYSGLEVFLDKASLNPVEAQDQIIGLEVAGLKELPFAQLAGLQDGDIIVTINNQAITSRQKALQVFKKSKSMSSMELELLRNNQTKTLSFNLP